MARQVTSSLSTTLLALSVLLSQGNTIWAGGRGGGGGPGVGGHGGFAGPGGYGHGYGGFYGRGYYGRGWGYGPFFGFGFGVGIYGVYAPYPYYDTVVVPGAYPAVSYASPVAGEPPLANPPVGENSPPPDNAAHLQLTVPENAEVWIAGTKSPQTGKVQEVVTPPLTPGKRYSYKIEVRYTDSTGKPVVDERKIRFRANDWYAVDFTRPVPPEPSKLPAPLPLPIPDEKDVK